MLQQSNIDTTGVTSSSNEAPYHDSNGDSTPVAATGAGDSDGPACDYQALREEAQQLSQKGFALQTVIPVALSAATYPKRRQNKRSGDWETERGADGRPLPKYTGKNPSYWLSNGKPQLAGPKDPTTKAQVLDRIQTAERLGKPIGLAIRPTPQLVVIDFDQKDYGSREELDQDWMRLLDLYPELGGTRIERTPGGGLHVYVKPADQMESWRTKRERFHCNFATTPSGEHRGEVLAEDRICICSPTRNGKGRYELLDPGQAFEVVEVENLEAIGIFPVAKKGTTEPTKKEVGGAFLTNQQLVDLSEESRPAGSSPPALADLIGDKARQVLQGGKPYGSSGDRSTQLTGFTKEVYSWENLLNKETLDYTGSADDLIKQAIKVLEIEDKADRVLDSIAKGDCSVQDAKNYIRHYWKLAGKKPPKPRQAEKEGEPLSSPPEAFGDFICALPDGWRLTENGVLPSRLSPGLLARNLEKLGEWLRFNELEMRPEVHTKKGWRVVSDADMGSAYVLLSQRGWLIGQEAIDKSVLYVSRKRSVHPVREYLLRIEEESSIAPYDLDQVGPAMFRAVTPLHATMVRKWLIGAVARALNPGCKMDYCLVLQSPKQGLYKSTAFAELASPEWHTSSIPKEEKDMLLNIHSTWLYELAELESFTSKREAGHIKNTLTTAIDNFRVPYGRTTEKKKRSGVFCGTANSDTFLRDDTGNRRFWIIPIEGDQKLDIAAIKKHRDSIWKAAVLAYRSGELPMLDDDQEALSEHQNDAYRERDAWREMLEAWIQGEPLFKRGMDGPPSKAFRLGDFYSSAEILYAAGLKQATQITRGEETRLGPLLRSLGFQKKRVVVGGHSLQRWYANSSDCNPAGESSGVSVDAPPETTRKPPITEAQLEEAFQAALASGNLRKFLPDEKGHPPLATTEVVPPPTCHRRTAKAVAEHEELEDWSWGAQGVTRGRHENTY